jgi:hypothetical protein
MSTTPERIDALLAEADALAPWTGRFDRAMLLEWLRLELGDATALDQWIDCGGVRSKAVPLSPVLHVVSGNTPHAAFQTAVRGLLVGAFNRVKIPFSGLPVFDEWVAGLPPVLSELMEIRHVLPEEWLLSEAAVIFGGGETIAWFREALSADVRRIEHGPKLSVGVIFEPSGDAARLLAEDILRHDQRGCLSVQAVYVAGDSDEVLAFGDELAVALADFRAAHGRGDFSISDSGAVSHARELTRFRAANGEAVRLWESAGSTAWTVVLDPDPKLLAGPLNGFVRLHPLPARLDGATLGPESGFISTVAIHPFGETYAGKLDELAPPRICALGKAQEPTIFWHHDGMPALASLVRWRDLG